MYGETDTLFGVKGIKGTDTLEFSYYKEAGVILVASFVSNDKEYSGLIPGQVEVSTSTASEESGSFSSITLYDNFLMPTDSIIISNCSYTVLK